MNRCKDPSLGVMLHAWELGMLSDEDRERYELHLLQCTSCADEAYEFARASVLLRRDLDLRPSTANIRFTSIRGRTGVKPMKRIVTRIALIAAVLILVIVPLYRVFISPSKSVETVQIVQLVPMRGDADIIVDRAKGGQVEFDIYVEGAVPQRSYRIVVSSLRGMILYSDSDYRGIDNARKGIITLPAASLPVGTCSISISSAEDSLIVVQQYFFRVK